MSIHEAHADTDGLGTVEESPIGNSYDEKSKMDDEKNATSKGPHEIQVPYNVEDDPAPFYTDEEGKLSGDGAVETNEDLVTRVIHVEDDPSLNPWTFRVFFLGKYDTAQLQIFSYAPMKYSNIG
jgi:hypothetical protein